ncbi:hypothetical protein AMECASPLE_006287 [Ameca splendens]|uniref:Secreted protein n=1 Tax=Ameca splendens TaxID=208324 RepID=A0ABV0ZXC0_9TELE
MLFLLVFLPPTTCSMSWGQPRTKLAFLMSSSNCFLSVVGMLLHRRWLMPPQNHHIYPETIGWHRAGQCYRPVAAEFFGCVVLVPGTTQEVFHSCGTFPTLRLMLNIYPVLPHS